VYKVVVSSQSDVPSFGPNLPEKGIFLHDSTFRDFILKKLINGELAAYHSKLFQQQFRHTYKQLLNQLLEDLGYSKKKQKKVSLKKAKDTTLYSTMREGGLDF